MSVSGVGKATILIIDDERQILELTGAILRNRGYDVYTAAMANVGLDLIALHHPHLVLLDYMMPGMDGLSTLREIRSQYPETYVIMFTGKGSEEVAVELMKAGASDYVLKPFNNQNLVERIESVLRIREVELMNRALTVERERLLAEIELWNRELGQRVEEKTEELRRAQGEMIQAEKLAALGHLATGMAHEIRNPLNSIGLFAQLLKTTDGVEDRAEYVERIVAEVERVDGLLRRLLEVARRPRFETCMVDLKALLDGVLEFFRPQLAAQRIALQLQVTAPPPLQADPTELEQVFSNLIANAIHEMQGGGTLTVTMEHDGAEVLLRVGDTGGGIPAEHLPRIFDPFFTTKSSGTGLGLALVNRIVRNYQGSIAVEKSDASGTIFCIRLPLGRR